MSHGLRSSRIHFSPMERNECVTNEPQRKSAGRLFFAPFRSSPSLEIQSTPLGLNPLVPQFCIHLSKRPSYYLWYLILYQRFYMVDIERFSDRYREKQTDEGLDWQPGNISVLLIYCSTEHVLETNSSLRKKISPHRIRNFLAFTNKMQMNNINSLIMLSCRLEVISQWA